MHSIRFYFPWRILPFSSRIQIAERLAGKQWTRLIHWNVYLIDNVSLFDCAAVSHALMFCCFSPSALRYFSASCLSRSRPLPPAVGGWLQLLKKPTHQGQELKDQERAAAGASGPFGRHRPACLALCECVPGSENILPLSLREGDASVIWISASV